MKIQLRQDAIRNNSRRYFTGKPCLRGHITERFVSTASCIECMKLHFQTWRSKNLERDRANSTKWQKANPEKVREHIAKRESGIANRIPPWSDRPAIKKIYEQAVELSKSTGIEYHVDHKIPLFGKLVSGLHIAENLQILTALENKKKGNSFQI